MNKWEYLVLNVVPSSFDKYKIERTHNGVRSNELESVLNKLGEDGWEAFSETSDTLSWSRILLKLPKA